MTSSNRIFSRKTRQRVWRTTVFYFVVFFVFGPNALTALATPVPDPPGGCPDNCPDPCDPATECCPDNSPASSSFPISLRYGAAIERVTDLRLNGPAFNWSHRRTYSSKDTVLNGVTTQGNGWLNNNDGCYLVKKGLDLSVLMSATSQWLFTWNASTSSYDPPEGYDATFVSNYPADTKDYDKDGNTTESYAVFEMWERRTSRVYIFASFDTNIAEGTRGKLVEVTNRHCLGSTTETGCKISYNASGEILQVTSPTGQEYNIGLAYSGGLLTKVEVKNASSSVIEKVEYTYFTAGTHHADLGSSGDLVEAKVSKLKTNGNPLTAADWIETYTQYRYDSGSRMKAVYSHDSICRAMADNSNLTDTAVLLTKSDSYSWGSTGGHEIQHFANKRFICYTSNEGTSNITTAFKSNEDLQTRYGGINCDETGMVKSETVGAGGCASCGGQSGIGITLEYYYMDISHTTPDWNDVVRIVVEDTKDSDGNVVTRRVQGLNETGQMLRDATIKDPIGTSPTYWCLSRKYSSTHEGRISEKRPPSAHTDVNTEAELKQFLDPSSGTNDASTLNDYSGLITTYTYNSKGRRTGTLVKKGETGTANYLSYTKYGDGTDDKPDFLPIETRTYVSKVSTSPETQGLVTSFAYTFWDTDDTQQKTKKTTLPAVSTSQNGSGEATKTWQYWDELGRLRWTKDGEGHVTYSSYHPETGGLAYRMVDVDTDGLPTEITAPSAGSWITWAGTLPTEFNNTEDSNLQLVTKQEYDNQGRATLATDVNGGKHFTLYQTEKTMRFPYIDATGTPQLPVQVTVTIDGQNTETYQVDPAKATTASNLPTGISATQADYVAWTRFSYDTLTGELSQRDTYHDIPSSGTGAFGTNYDSTNLLYDPMGRRGATVQYVAASKYQVSAQLFDVRGRNIETRTGVATTAPTDYDDLDNDIGTTPTGFNGYAIVSTSEYDGGSVGDGRVTQSKRFYGTASTEFIETNLHHTWRGHLRGVARKNNTTAFGPYNVMDVDWLGRTTDTAQYSVAPTNWTTLVDDEDYVASTSTNRNNWTKTKFDDLGRTYQTLRYPGTESTKHFEVNNYYDRNGRLVCTGDKYSAHQEYAYDGAGRQYQQRIVKDVSSSSPYSSGAFTYNAPLPKPDFTGMSGGNGGVIDLTHIEYDGGQVIASHQIELNHDDTNGFSMSSGDATGGIRMTAFYWFDEANRLTTTANYGAGDGTSASTTWKHTSPVSRPATELAWTDSKVYNGYVLLSKTGYHTKSGRQDTVTVGTEKNGSNTETQVTKTFFDDLGRRTYVAENYDDFDPDTLTTISDSSDGSKDRVTNWVYNGLGQTEKLTAFNGSNTAKQETIYLFEDDEKASLATNTIYPDSSDTTGSGTDQVKTSYHLDGSIDTRTDQRGVVLTYTYDNARRTTLQAATSIPVSVDSSVEAIGRSYDSMGRLEKITSYDGTTTASTVLNEVKLTYGTTGQVTKSEQDHADAVGGTEPAIEYAFDVDATSNVYTDGLRPEKTTYPDSRVSYQDYGGTGDSASLNDRLSRLQRLRETSSAGAILTEYKYNGKSRLVKSDYVVPDVHREMFSSASDYDAWDQFGRTVAQQWEDYTGTATTRDQIDYTYDYAGNRLTRDVNGTSTLDQTYTYDGLHRLQSSDESTAASDRYWQLDQLGNWDKLRNGLTDTSTVLEDRSHNDANELTAFVAPSSTVDPLYDNAGNMTTMPDVKHPSWLRSLKYDAWNRLVEIRASNGNRINSFDYDGLNRRIMRKKYSTNTDSLLETRHFYYNQQWQVIEERLGTSTSANKQFVYHPNYVDAIAMRRDASGNDHYYLQDANFNVTAVTDDTGAVVERYAYTPYGEVTVLDDNFSADSDGKSDISNEHLYTGRRRDPETGLQLNRNRFYASGLGRWVNRDPIERMLIEAGLTRVKRSGLMIMVGGVVSTAERVNLYAAHFVPNGLDPSGLRRIKWPWTPPGGPVDREECNWVNWMTGSCCTTNQTNAFRHACAKAGLCLGTSYCSATKRFNAFSCEECDKTDQCSFADCDSGKSCGESGTRSCQWDGNRCGCFAGGGIDDPCD